MANINYSVLHVKDADLNRIQQNLKESFERTEALLNEIFQRIKKIEKERKSE